MKKLLFSMMAVSILLLTSCKEDEVFPSLKGTVWILTYDWDPQNPPGGDGTAEIVFKANGTFEVESLTGTWTQNDDNVSFVFTSGGADAQYTGTISGDSMSGTSLDPPTPVNGTWSAVRY